MRKRKICKEKNGSIAPHCCFFNVHSEIPSPEREYFALILFSISFLLATTSASKASQFNPSGTLPLCQFYRFQSSTRPLVFINCLCDIVRMECSRQFLPVTFPLPLLFSPIPFSFPSFLPLFLCLTYLTPSCGV